VEEIRAAVSVCRAYLHPAAGNPVLIVQNRIRETGLDFGAPAAGLQARAECASAYGK